VPALRAMPLRCSTVTKALPPNRTISGIDLLRARLSRQLKGHPFRLEDGFIAIVVKEFDLDRAVVEEFGGSFALDFVPFPVKTDRGAGVFDFETGLQGAKGDVAALGRDRQRRRAGEIEVSTIPEVSLDDPPAADQSAVRRGLPAQASMSFGNRVRL